MPMNSGSCWPRFGHSLLLLIFSGVISTASMTSLRGAEALLPAPYQVEAVERSVPYSYTEDESLGPPMITVDLGTAEGRTPPVREGLETMTFLGAGGSAVGQLYDISKHCDYLCGDELEECHYVARYSLPPDTPALEAPLAALPGTLELTDYHDPRQAEWIDNFTLAYVWTATGFSPEAWRPSSQGATSHKLESWNEDSKDIAFRTRFPDGNEFSAQAGSCRLRQGGDLNEVACNGLSLLFAEGTPLLLSYPDYNSPAARAVSSFTQGDRTYYLVLLGLKAQSVFGLLTKTLEGWIGHFQPRDYALLC